MPQDDDRQEDSTTTKTILAVAKGKEVEVRLTIVEPAR